MATGPLLCSILDDSAAAGRGYRGAGVGCSIRSGLEDEEGEVEKRVESSLLLKR